MTRKAQHIRSFRQFALSCLIAAALGLTALTGASTASAVDISPIEHQTVIKINDYRAARGLPRLRIDMKLTKTAEWMSTAMGVHQFFSHTDHLGRDPFQRLKYFTYPSDTWRGENLAAGNELPQDTFEQWVNSPAHKANMLTSQYRAIGIARVYNASSPYGYYWTTTFGSRIIRIAPTRTLIASYSYEKRVRIYNRSTECLKYAKTSYNYYIRNCRAYVPAGKKLGYVVWAA